MHRYAYTYVHHTHYICMSVHTHTHTNMCMYMQLTQKHMYKTHMQTYKSTITTCPTVISLYFINGFSSTDLQTIHTQVNNRITQYIHTSVSSQSQHYQCNLTALSCTGEYAPLKIVCQTC